MADILAGAGFVAATVVVVLAIYAGARVVLHRWSGDGTDALAGSVLVRISALHGLILALVFAQELNQYGELQQALTDEATAVADIWNDMARYGGPGQAEVQSALTAYVREVVATEWGQLGSAVGLSDAAWAEWDAAYEGVLSLDPETPRETALRAHMLDGVHAISRLRDERAAEALYGLSRVFWLAAVAGVVLVVVPFFVHPPSVLHLTLLAIFAGYTGLVLHLIYAFANPFSEPGLLPPSAFERLLETPVGGG